MRSTTKKFSSLSRQIVLRFCVFTLALCVVYSLFSLVLMYTLEDSFIEKDILQEVDYLTAQYEQSGKWPASRKSNMQLHFSHATFPDDMREKSLQEPLRHEFYGENGRHYHLYKLPDYQQVFLLAEVSNDLLVRPIRAGVIKFLTISSLIVTIIACFIAWLIGRKTTKPLKQLVGLVDGVAPEHIPHAFASQFPNNEVGVLAHTLEHSFKRLEQAFEREKSFTRDVSHELRTPLAVIQNAVELHNTHTQPPNEQAEVIKRIEQSAQQMEATVYTLLALAREEQANAKNTSIELMPIVERSVLDHHQLLENKDIQVNIHDNCKVKLNAQAGMLKILLDNLLSNAFQYTVKGEVSVSFAHGNLVVQDSGPGIQPDISDKVTEPAVKGSQSTGFGFGLSIVTRLCEHQGWLVKVESAQGTKISVQLS